MSLIFYSTEKNVSNNLQSEEKIGANDDTHRNKDPVLDDEEKKGKCSIFV